MSYKALSREQVIDRLCEKKKTLIVYHARPDADAIGSAFALRDLLGQMGIEATCLCTHPIPARLGFLTREGEDHRPFGEASLPAFERVISVDSASPAQLGELFPALDGRIDLMIDHHESGTVYADYYVIPTAAATGEIILSLAEELLERGKISSISPDICNDLYAAISSDTGCFRFANVTPATLRAAARLLEGGATAAEINHALFESKTEAQMRAEGEAARRLFFAEGRTVAGVTFPYEVKAALGVVDENLETIIDIPRSVEGVKVAFAIRQPEDRGFFRVSMRSAGDCNVASVCAELGGGGHRRAAGCSLTADTIEEATEQLLAVIRRHL